MQRLPPSSPRTDSLFPSPPPCRSACVAPGIVGHAQPPRAVEALDRQVAGVGLDDVVGSAAGAVVQAINAAVRCEQVHLQVADVGVLDVHRSEEHTSELQSLMRISSAVFCLTKKNTKNTRTLY